MSGRLLATLALALAAGWPLQAAHGQPYTLTGTVTLEGGGGGAGAQIMLAGPDGDMTTTADAAGDFSFSGLSGGEYTVSASLKCYETSSVPVSVPAALQVSLSLMESVHTVTGMVTLEGATGVLSGTTVILTQNASTVATAATDPLGGYRFEDVCAGSYEVTASREAFASKTVSIDVDGPSEVPEVRLDLLGPFAVSGKVHVSSGDASGIEVRVEGTELSAMTGADGSFSVQGVPIGVHTLIASRQGLLAARVPNLLVSSPVNLDIFMSPTPALRDETAGCAVSSRRPHDGISLLLFLLAVAVFGFAAQRYRQRGRC